MCLRANSAVGDTRRKQRDRMGRGRKPKTGSPQPQDEEGALNAQDGRDRPPLDDSRGSVGNIRKELEERHCGYQGPGAGPGSRGT